MNWGIDTLFTITASASVGVLLTFLFLGWHGIRKLNKTVIFAFSTLVSVSTFTRLFIYRAGYEPAPMWYPTTVDIIMTVVSVSLIASIWTYIVKKV